MSPDAALERNVVFKLSEFILCTSILTPGLSFSKLLIISSSASFGASSTLQDRNSNVTSSPDESASAAFSVFPPVLSLLLSLVEPQPANIEIVIAAVNIMDTIFFFM